MAQGKGFFISPAGELLEVPDRHILMVLAEPRSFGTTRAWVEKVYKRHGEPLGIERNARRKILLHVMKKDWIRIREYYGNECYWIFQVGA